MKYIPVCNRRSTHHSQALSRQVELCTCPAFASRSPESRLRDPTHLKPSTRHILRQRQIHLWRRNSQLDIRRRVERIRIALTWNQGTMVSLILFDDKSGSSASLEGQCGITKIREALVEIPPPGHRIFIRHTDWLFWVSDN